VQKTRAQAEKAMTPMPARKRAAPAGIFISYRRADAAGEAGRLADHLERRLGEQAVFLDVADIAVGSDWRQRLDQALDQCDTMLVVIGRQWLDMPSPRHPGMRRLEEPGDMVAWEVARALSRGLRVVQVLVQDAAVPAAEALPPTLAALASRQATTLRHESFAADVQQLVVRLGRSRRARTAFESEWLASDLSSWARVLDSGPEGTCLPISIVNGLELLLARAGLPLALSARYLYEKTHHHQGGSVHEEGTFPLPTFFVAAFFGVPAETVWPYVPESRALPHGLNWSRLERTAGWRCRGDFFRVDGLADVVRQLAAGRPVVAMVHHLEGSLDEVRKDGVVPMPRPRARDDGLTTMLLTGYDPSRREFRAMGTWGKSHGERGFFRFAVDVARRLLDPEGLWSVQLAAGVLEELRATRPGAQGRDPAASASDSKTRRRSKAPR